jgi:P-type Cu+ transporter
MKTVEYYVTGMTCGGCASSVRRVVSRNKGVSDVEVENMENRVVVTYDENLVDDELIMSQINRLGFKAEVKQ